MYGWTYIHFRSTVWLSYCVAFVESVSVCVSLLCCIIWRINSHYVVISSICYLLLCACLTKAPKHIDFRNIQYFVGYFLAVCVFCFCVFFWSNLLLWIENAQNWKLSYYFCRCIRLSNIRHLYFMALNIFRCDKSKNKMQIIFCSPFVLTRISFENCSNWLFPNGLILLSLPIFNFTQFLVLVIHTGFTAERIYDIFSIQLKWERGKWGCNCTGNFRLKITD